MYYQMTPELEYFGTHEDIGDDGERAVIDVAFMIMIGEQETNIDLVHDVSVFMAGEFRDVVEPLKLAAYILREDASLFL